MNNIFQFIPASLPHFSSPAPSLFPPLIASTYPSSIFPSSSSFSFPTPAADPRASASPPLAPSLPFCPPFASGSTPSTTTSFSFPIFSILSSAPSSIPHGLFAHPLPPVSASFLSPLPFVSSASLSSTTVSWSLPAVVSCLLDGLCSFRSFPSCSASPSFGSLSA